MSIAQHRRVAADACAAASRPSRLRARASSADAEQGIDGQVVVARAASARTRTPASARALQRSARHPAAGLPRRREGDDGVEPAPLQLRRRLEAVAAVVAGPAGDPDRAGMRRQCHGEPRDRQAGALHQRVRRQARCGRPCSIRRVAATSNSGAALSGVMRCMAARSERSAACGVLQRCSRRSMPRPSISMPGVAAGDAGRPARARCRTTAPSRSSRGPG